MNLVFIVMWVVSIAFSAVIGVAALTYIRRTWQLIRAEDDHPTRDRLLDGMDHLENQMHLVAERLAKMEAQLAELDARLEPTGPRASLPVGGDRASLPDAGDPASLPDAGDRAASRAGSPDGPSDQRAGEPAP